MSDRCDLELLDDFGAGVVHADKANLDSFREPSPSVTSSSVEYT